MATTVEPQAFRFVHFDADVIARVADELSAMLAIDRPLHIEVDETTPLGKVTATIGDIIALHAQSGAFEDTKRPRHQSEIATAVNLGRILLRTRDRIKGGFGEAPADDDLSLRQMAAWETYCAGRLSRLGLKVPQPRWLYNFRNRHGFTDLADAAFEQIWSADALTWGELDAISSAAAASLIS
jgi:hypothetical protein